MLVLLLLRSLLLQLLLLVATFDKLKHLDCVHMQVHAACGV
jgi:hypothetical protein